MAQFEKAASVKLTRNAAKNCWKIPSSVVKHGKVCLPRISIYSLLFLAGQSITEIKAPVFSSVSQGRGSSRSTHISAECSWRVDSLQKYTRVYSLWTACKNIHMDPAQQAAARSVWQKADAVCFDVDSTVCRDEGLDELAEFCGVGQQVKAWTLKAMGGDVSFREALSERLKIVNPSLQQVEAFVASRSPQLSEGIVELVSLLQSRNTAVYLISGGFRRLIEPAAQHLNIPLENIFANRLLFENDGQFCGFDTEEPTSESGGKPRVVALLKEKHGYQNLVMIGDGATDMEASPPADAFIGYGGNIVRDKVKNNADWFVTDFKELICALQQPAEQRS